MPTEIQITCLRSNALDEAVVLQARAFFNDPLVDFVFPAEAARRESLPLVMRVLLAYSSRFGHVYTGATSMLGHAVWLPPGAGGLVTGCLDPMSVAALRQQMGELAFSRFATLLEQTALIQSRLLVPGPYWYLMMLGVDPPHQGHGVGGALLQPILTCADVEHFACYAETANERSLAFYHKHRFEVAGEHRLQPDGPLVWTMVRGPRRPERHCPRSYLDRNTIGAARRVRAAVMVTPAEIPAPVVRFVAEHIRSLEQLELLLLLVQSPDRWWDALSVARELGMNTDSAERALERFASHNLLAIAVTGDVRYRFQPGEPRLREAAEAFNAAYRTNRLAILHLVTGRPQRSIRDFAKAFRIRRDDDR